MVSHSWLRLQQLRLKKLRLKQLHLQDWGADRFFACSMQEPWDLMNETIGSKTRRKGDDRRRLH